MHPSRRTRNLRSLGRLLPADVPRGSHPTLQGQRPLLLPLQVGGGQGGRALEQDLCLDSRWAGVATRDDPGLCSHWKCLCCLWNGGQRHYMCKNNFFCTKQNRKSFGSLGITRQGSTVGCKDCFEIMLLGLVTWSMKQVGLFWFLHKQVRATAWLPASG